MSKLRIEAEHKYVDLGYLKLDILGLKTVSVLDEIERMVNNGS